MSDEHLLRVKKMTLETEDDRICVGLIPTGMELKRGWLDLTEPGFTTILGLNAKLNERHTSIPTLG